jgi:hypothetical protein
MAYASKVGRARVSAKRPLALAVCYRCGFWRNRIDLHFQYEWRGTSLTNIYILVCDDCLDIPQEQLRAIVLPADPAPIYWPSVEDFAGDETNYRATIPVPGTRGLVTVPGGQAIDLPGGQGLLTPGGGTPAPVDPITGLPIPATTLRVTQDCQNRITQPIGCPDGLIQDAVMPYNGGVQKAFGVPLSVLSVVANGTATVVVTCSKVHGLQPNNQISAAGLSAANGFYSVKVLTATAFSYMTAYDIPAGSLLTPTARIVTALVGLPRGSETIPKVGCEGPSPMPAPAPSIPGQYVLLPGGQAADLPGGQGIITP